METEDVKKALLQAFNDGHLKGYEEGIDAMIGMLNVFRDSFYKLKEERMKPE